MRIPAPVRHFGVSALAALSACAPASRAPAGASAPNAAGAAAPDARTVPQGRWLRILATNDFHGAFEPVTDAEGTRRGGAVALAAAIAEARAQCPAPRCVSILLDGGDEFQGTLPSNFTFGRAVVELFNHLGYTAAALGNHEFDWGQDTLRARMRDARYAVLGANVRMRAGGDASWVRDDTLVTVDGVRIGIVGISTLDTPRSTRPTNVADLSFAQPAAVADERARALRSRGAELVVVVAHAGAFCDRTGEHDCHGEIVDLAERATERIDAIVSGHTHSAVATRVRGIPIVQARTRGTTLGVIDVPRDAGAQPRIELRDVRPRDGAAGDAAVAEIVRRAVDATRARVEQPIAEIAERLDPGVDEPLGNLIADAQRAAGDGDFAIMNAGGVRAALPAGTATYGRLFEVQPFGNALMRATFTGAALRRYFERIVGGKSLRIFLSGGVVEYDPARPAGSRVLSIKLANGSALDDAKSYRLILSDFLAVGGDGLGVEGAATSVEPLGVVDLDALIALLRSLPSPVRGPNDRRFNPVDR